MFELACASLASSPLALSGFPGAALFVGEAWDSAFVEIDHIHYAIDFADHFGGAHIGERFGEKLAAGNGLTFMGDFPVPFDHLQVFGEKIAE